MTRILIKTVEIEIDPGQPLGQLLREALHGYPVGGTTTIDEVAEPVRALPASLDPKTARCERCGCTWDEPCPEGCAWDIGAWQQGRALCTSCVTGLRAEVDLANLGGVSLEVLQIRHPSTTGTASAEQPTPKPRRQPKVAKEKKGAAKARAPKAVKATAPKVAKNRGGGGGGSRSAPSAEIQERLGRGESPTVIAEALGITASAVYAQRKKLNGTPAKGTPKEAPDRPTYRCQNCGQRGYDPKRCDHCQEKR
jgi:hypothetical protein